MNDKKVVFVELPSDKHRRFKAICVEQERSMTQVIEELIDLQIAQREKELARK